MVQERLAFSQHHWRLNYTLLWISWWAFRVNKSNEFVGHMRKYQGPPPPIYSVPWRYGPETTNRTNTSLQWLLVRPLLFFRTSVRPSVRMFNLNNHYTIFDKICFTFCGKCWSRWRDILCAVWLTSQRCNTLAINYCQEILCIWGQKHS